MQGPSGNALGWRVRPNGTLRYDSTGMRHPAGGTNPIRHMGRTALRGRDTGGRVDRVRGPTDATDRLTSRPEPV